MLTRRGGADWSLKEVVVKGRQGTMQDGVMPKRWRHTSKRPEQRTEEDMMRRRAAGQGTSKVAVAAVAVCFLLCCGTAQPALLLLYSTLKKLCYSVSAVALLFFLL